MSVSRRHARMRQQGWITVPAAASLANVDRATIYRWLKAKYLEATKHAGNRYIRKKSLKKFLVPKATKGTKAAK